MADSVAEKRITFHLAFNKLEGRLGKNQLHTRSCWNQFWLESIYIIGFNRADIRPVPAVLDHIRI